MEDNAKRQSPERKIHMGTRWCNVSGHYGPLSPAEARAAYGTCPSCHRTLRFRRSVYGKNMGFPRHRTGGDQ